MIQVRDLGASFGAEVGGWEPARALRPDDRERIRAALRDHSLLVFRGHTRPTDAELARFAAEFGQTVQGGEIYGLPSSSRVVLRVSNEPGPDGYDAGYAGSGYMPWHTDYSYMPRAAKETFLEAVHVPSEGPRTHWCHMYRAYETLPDALRERVGGLVGLHDPMASARHAPSPDTEQRRGRATRTHPRARLPYSGTPAAHPVVRQHPETGRRALYVDTFVERFEGMGRTESEALLDELLAHALRPERLYTHEWQSGDLVMFDTVGTMHSRDDHDYRVPRSMRQVSTLLPA